MTLNGEIGINVYLDIPENQINENTIIHVEYNGNTEEIKANELEIREQDGIERRVVVCTAYAKNMRDLFTITVRDPQNNLKPLKTPTGRDKTNGYAISVSLYLQSAATSSETALRELASAMDTYGIYAQRSTGYKPEQLEGVVPADVSGVTETMLSPYKGSAEGSISGIEVSSASLIMESETRCRIYYKLTEGDIGSYAFTAGGRTVSPVYDSEKGLYYIESKGIAAKDLGKSIAFIVKKGSESMTLNYSGLAYAYSIVRKASSYDETTVGLAKAIYMYNQAAITLFSD